MDQPLAEATAKGSAERAASGGGDDESAAEKLQVAEMRLALKNAQSVRQPNREGEQRLLQRVLGRFGGLFFPVPQLNWELSFANCD